MATLKETRAALINEVVALCDQAQAEDRDLTEKEASTVEAKHAEIKALDSRIVTAEKAAGIARGLQSPGAADTGAKGNHWDAKALPKIATKMTEVVKAKAFGLVDVPDSVDLFGGAPQLAESGDVGTLHALLPLKPVDSPNVEWIVEQGGYINKAAVWVPGTTKPESTTTFEKKTGKMAVVALMSAPYGQLDAMDSPELVAALHTRLLIDLQGAVDGLILDGSVDYGLTGLRNTSGVQIQAFVTDELLTMRQAITKVERLGIRPSAFVLSHDAWERIETSKTTTGEYLFAEGPVDRVNKRIWGVPVTVTDQVTTDEAFLVSADAVNLTYVRNQGVMVEVTNTHADDFSRNNQRSRLETRMGIAVTRPMGVVQMTLAAA
ncbi:phage major capsid protein [Kocuria rosea]|uniref:phage major capsid protein n=1 Tax=Kocuria rosea TaxID=1275 RepID=UPI00119EB32E|nr:phage major capsid protein [Kocuria rosea]